MFLTLPSRELALQPSARRQPADGLSHVPPPAPGAAAAEKPSGLLAWGPGRTASPRPAPAPGPRAKPRQAPRGPTTSAVTPGVRGVPRRQKPRQPAWGISSLPRPGERHVEQRGNVALSFGRREAARGKVDRASVFGLSCWAEAVFCSPLIFPERGACASVTGSAPRLPAFVWTPCYKQPQHPSPRLAESASRPGAAPAISFFLQKRMTVRLPFPRSRVKNIKD